jgi:hypothetical protein
VDEPPPDVEIPGVDDDVIENQPAENPGMTVNHGYALRPRPPPGTVPTHLAGRGYENAFNFVTTQMSAKKGLRLFGQQGADAITAELEQLHYRDVIQPLRPDEMTREERQKSLYYLMYLKRKRCGRIKARGCADGRKQRLWKTKDETSSPTVRLESLFLSTMIDSHERRKVITCDIPGAFMQADIDEVVHVKFEGDIAKLLAQVDERTYRPYLVTENGKTVLYVQLKKALYGTLQAALLFWKELSEYIVKELGFTINPYDECVANKIIDGKQCTILWYVDDLKLSHVDQAVIEDVLAKLNARFGKEQELVATRGDVHEYLGMTIDYSVPGSVKITMQDFVDNLLDELPEDMEGTRLTPAADFLFGVRKDAPKLDKRDAEQFHTIVMKLLYLCKRIRPDLGTAVAFLTTRVTSPDEDDRKKLKRCLQYLRSSRDLPLTLTTSDPTHIKWYVDASFAIHSDMRSHTGMIMTMGEGAIMSMSTRQKLNTTSSTEAELVGVHDTMGHILWTRNFLKSQGLNVRTNVVYQDNQSAMLLAKNGRSSSGKRTRHINIRYFFVKDRIKKGHMTLEYCPTEQMLADILTKPLHGSQFRYFRARILNLQDPHSSPPVSQECVRTSSYDERPSELSTPPEPHNIGEGSVYSTSGRISESASAGVDVSEDDTEKGHAWTVVKNRKLERLIARGRNIPHNVSST